MAVDFDLLERLRERGATKVSFHPDGSIATIEYAAAAMPHIHDTQHENTTPVVTPPRRPTGQLVPRGDRSSA